MEEDIKHKLTCIICDVCEMGCCDLRNNKFEWDCCTEYKPCGIVDEKLKQLEAVFNEYKNS